MLLTLLCSFIFFANTFTIGYYCWRFINYFLNQQNNTLCVLNIFLVGFIATYCYCNICSFFIAVDYKIILPIVGITIITIVYKKKELVQLIQNYFTLYKNYYLQTIVLAFVFLFFLSSPPINTDSRDYHFTSIFFYEHFKVIPGLANIHGRLAFNPANFIVSAAYGFTGVFKQSIYPVNLVLVTVFISWFLIKLIGKKNVFVCCLACIAFIYILKQFFPNIASPSSDTLALIIALYIGITLYGMFSKKTKDPYNFITILICCCFGITVKITLFPLLAIIPLLIFFNKEILSKKMLLFGIVFIMLLFIPWLARNIIMSGYLVYPILQLDFFDFTWKTPKEVLELDIYFILFSPKWVEFDIYNFPINFYNWIPTWIVAHIKMNRLLELPFLLSALFSPIIWLFIFIRKIEINKKIISVWLVYYAGCIWWLFTSPEYRFGYSFLIIAALYPLFYYFSKLSFISASKPTIISLQFAVFFYIIIAGYKQTQHHRYYTSSFKNYWLYPLKDKELLKGVDNVYRIEQYKNFKVYYADMTDCIHFENPCVGWKYGLVQPLGNTIESGFRLKTNEVYNNYPFIKK